MIRWWTTRRLQEEESEEKICFIFFCDELIILSIYLFWFIFILFFLFSVWMHFITLIIITIIIPIIPIIIICLEIFSMGQPSMNRLWTWLDEANERFEFVDWFIWQGWIGRRKSLLILTFYLSFQLELWDDNAWHLIWAWAWALFTAASVIYDDNIRLWVETRTRLKTSHMTYIRTEKEEEKWKKKLRIVSEEKKEAIYQDSSIFPKKKAIGLFVWWLRTDEEGESRKRKREKKCLKNMSILPLKWSLFFFFKICFPPIVSILSCVCACVFCCYRVYILLISILLTVPPFLPNYTTPSSDLPGGEFYTWGLYATGSGLD